jgi:hypothetical protein
MTGPPRRARAFRFEAELYPPVKRLLEAQGYAVKGEVGGCDLVAVRGADEPPVVVELKLAVTLSLVLQGVDRLAITDLVYLAVPAASAGRAGAAAARSPAHPQVQRLCRRLGLGLLAVHPPGAGGMAARAEPVLDPVPVRVPRRNRRRAAHLLSEHSRRQGDPSPGGSSGGPVVTAYRQEALRCAGLLQRHNGGPLPVATLRQQAAAPRAGRILHRRYHDAPCGQVAALGGKHGAGAGCRRGHGGPDGHRAEQGELVAGGL